MSRRHTLLVIRLVESHELRDDASPESAALSIAHPRPARKEIPMPTPTDGVLEVTLLLRPESDMDPIQIRPSQ